MLFCMNETNIERTKIRQCKKRQKGVNPPRGDGEWARKSLFQKWFYLLLVTESENWNYQKILGPYTGWNQDLTIIQKILRILWKKGDPWGDLNTPKATSYRIFLYFLSELIKNSEHVIIT